MKNVDFRQWQKALGTALSVLLAFTLAWASPMGGGFSHAAASGVVVSDAVPMSDGVSTVDELIGDKADAAEVDNVVAADADASASPEEPDGEDPGSPSVSAIEEVLLLALP